MKILNAIKKILYSSTFVFTVTVFVITLFYKFTAEADTPDTSGIQMDKYLPLYLFSLVVGALDNLLTWKKLNLAIRVPLHFVGVMTSVYVVFITIFKLGQTSHGRFSVMLILSVVYAIILGVSFLIRVGFIRLCRSVSEASEKKAAEKAAEAEKAKAEAEEK